MPKASSTTLLVSMPSSAATLGFSEVARIMRPTCVFSISKARQTMQTSESTRMMICVTLMTRPWNSMGSCGTSEGNSW